VWHALRETAVDMHFLTALQAVQQPVAQCQDALVLFIHFFARDAEGFAQITVVDADGRSDTAQVRLKAEN
jgi:hypothetical protein